MSEEKTVSKPMQFWNKTLRAVKGDSTQQLVEEFTSEMTLVAEGLVDDQARLRKAVEDLTLESDRGTQKVRSEIEALETTIEEHQRDVDRRLTELGRRLDAIEAHQKHEPAKKEKNYRDKLIPQLTWLAAIVGGSLVLIKLLDLFR